MAVFTYRAIDPSTASQSGTIAADTPRQARDLLRERRLTVQRIESYRSAHSPPARLRFRKQARAHEVTSFIRELSTLLSVGVPLLEALTTIARQHHGIFHAIVLLLRDRVAAGSSLASAMREHPNVFDELAINITEVGEDAGTLESSLERLAEFRERGQQLKSRIGNALIYPAIVLAMAVFSSIFLMTFVVPRILQPLIEQGQEMPLPTRVVKAASDFLLGWWWLIAIAATCGFAGATVLLRSVNGRRAWDRLILKLPLIGDLATKQAIVRICIVVSTLLKSGIVFVRATQIAQRTVGNSVLRDALVRAERSVSAGGDIAEAMEQTEAFPPMVVQIFSLGQQSGRLEEMLDRLAITYDQQVQSAAQRLTAILEPILILVLACIVLFIILATVLPILEAGNAIQ
jgi:type II secretory pathway component PulF